MTNIIIVITHFCLISISVVKLTRYSNLINLTTLLGPRSNTSASSEFKENWAIYIKHITREVFSHKMNLDFFFYLSIKTVSHLAIWPDTHQWTSKPASVFFILKRKYFKKFFFNSTTEEGH